MVSAVQMYVVGSVALFMMWAARSTPASPMLHLVCSAALRCSTIFVWKIARQTCYEPYLLPPPIHRA